MSSKILKIEKKLFINPNYIENKSDSNNYDKNHRNISNKVNNEFVPEKKLKIEDFKDLKWLISLYKFFGKI